MISGRMKEGDTACILYSKVLPTEEAELRYEQQLRVAHAAGFSVYKKKMVARLAK